VVPVTAKGEVLDAEAADNRGYDGLFGWMRKAEAVWNGHRPSEISFVQQLDYYGKLATQFPIAPLRVVYTESGTNPAACILRNRSNVNGHKLYWAPVDNEDEASYLCIVLNCEVSRSRIEAYQSRGQWGARDFDKVMFNLPIPRFEAADPLHTDLAAAAAEAETIAAAVPIADGVKFQRARKLVRDALIDAGLAERIDGLVARLLDGD